jgi:uncharacterized protein YggE
MPAPALRRLPAVLALAVAAAVALPTAPAAQAPAGAERTVVATGSGQALVELDGARDRAARDAALAAAEEKAARDAVAAARRRATALAKAGGLTLGAVLSMRELSARPPGTLAAGRLAPAPLPHALAPLCLSEPRPLPRRARSRGRRRAPRLAAPCAGPVTVTVSVTFAAS